VRTVADAAALADAGVARVVMGSAAVREPSLVADVNARVGVDVAVGLDHRGGVLATEGWTRSSGVNLVEALGMYPTAACAVITDISRDGMLVGPDIEGLTAAARNAPMPVIASGGVGTVADIVALCAIPNIEGVITGKAIYEGRFTLVDALRSVEGGKS
jgi:phosphoribosylformimino-5-aminoimidazole carboxamide ribonucleotide (ProFAR) isomerase